MVNNDALYSAIEYDEPFEPALKIKPDWTGDMNEVSDEFQDYP